MIPCTGTCDWVGKLMIDGMPKFPASTRTKLETVVRVDGPGTS